MKVKNLDGFKKEPIISVIVPVYNSESYLKDCLDSIIEQTYEKSRHMKIWKLYSLMMDQLMIR